ncbi:NAD(P)/FAD-dependent oxidoreductase [Thiohalorhabdus denitrificans]|uniref:Protein CbrA n=1 Tax=Thiohalorhabdus denitrificans TaxID=381306 RepID=A0A1G5AUP8_9GAMM|nr:NAD(P)/FAD-dependent oxidoreductase [Thiohalorhabdus denitrificans]SCX81645.1 geranylgeranyl reductase family [Thiohalorhabdus denitrificans]
MSEKGFDAEVLVIGGGPGGSTAAWDLARQGVDVLVLDGAEFPRVKLCAGWITPQILDALELDPEAYPHTISPFSSAVLWVGDTPYRTDYRRPVSYGIIRAEFDHYLLERAREAGARFANETIRTVEAGPEAFEVTTRDGSTYRAPLAIGAGGSKDPIRRQLTTHAPEERMVVTLESETRVGAERIQAHTPYFEVPELFLEPDFNGYAWYFTKGDFLNIGIGRLGDPRIRDAHPRFLEKLRDLGRLTPELEADLTKFRGHPYKIYDSVPNQAHGDRFLLVGDAAGLARHYSGEGIRPAVESARDAAAVARSALERGRFAAKDLEDYPQRLTERYGPQKAPRFDPTRWIPHSWQGRIVEGICRSDRLRRDWVFGRVFLFDPEAAVS